MARAFLSADARARTLGIAFVVAVALVGTTAFSIVGCSGAARPRLAMINALPSTRPAPTSTPPASPHTTPISTATDTATRAGGSGQPGGAAGSPPGQWQYAEDSGPMFGSAGAVYTFRVAVESGQPVTVPEFTGVVDSALGDYRGWAGAGRVRMLRVPGGSASNFTVVLARPWTAYSLCQSIGIDIRVNGVPFTNCQASATIVINADRYFGGVGGYGASLSVYRQYAINHEVGHRLGHGHVPCPGPGQPAPVMQQQTLGLSGCLANPWPYPTAAPPPPDPIPTPTPTASPTTTPPPGTPTPTPQPPVATPTA